jgi:3-hydroxyisobutyrate dehydrogenase-like beta-hydroxyacid dehydrogenase
VSGGEQIGLVGIGLVGTALAERLVAGGLGVIGCDVDAARREHLERLGGRAVETAAQVAREVKRVLLSLPTTDVVFQVVHGPGGVLSADRLPEYVIDTTTGDPEQTESLARELDTRGVAFLDATISGSSQQIRDGMGAFMVGGEAQAFDACRDILDILSSHVFYVGPCGSGSRAKLASNLILGLNRLVLAEGLVFAEKLGLELAPFLDLLKATPAYSAAMDAKGIKMLEGDFTPQARLRQHRKDVALMVKYARAAGLQLPLTEVHLDILDQAIEAGDGDLDNSAVIRQLRRRR